MMPARRHDGTALMALLLALSLMGVLAAAMLFSGSTLLPDGWQMRWVKVDGNFQRVSAEQVRAAVATRARGGFFQVDPEAVQQAAERLPWVARAVVRKSWPDTIRVRVLEHEPMARWGTEALINTEGQRFRVPEGGAIQGLPVLDGPEGSVATVVDRFLELRQMLEGKGLDVRQLSLDARGDWRTTLSYGIRVALGSQAVSDRLERFAGVYGEHFAARARRLEHVDLRYTNGFAVKWREADPEQTSDNKEDSSS